MIAFLLLALALAGTDPASVGDPIPEEAAARALPGCDRIEKETFVFTAELRAAVAARTGGREAPVLFRCFVGRKDDRVEGYAVIDDVLGKSRPITYLLATDAALRIRSVEILAYRESHGGEIRQSGWRGQFVGKDSRSALRVGADIRNIAGATISCRAVTDGVRMQLACLETALRGGAGRAGAGERADAGVVVRAPPAAPASAAGSAAELRRTRLLMGTTLEIRAFAPPGDAREAALEAAFDEVARLEAILSDWREDSQVSRLKRAAGGEPQPVAPELLDLIRVGLDLHRSTSGAFDATVGPLVAVWRSAAARGVVPADEEVRTALERTGPAAIEIDLEHGTARLGRPGSALDFGGIGKGYALDRAAAVLRERGIPSALLNFGGQVLALDPPPGETGWIVDVRDPGRPGGILATLRLARASLACTADTERGLEIAGRRFSHVLDPRTGRPVEGMLGTAVVAPSATEADALSTALYVLGEEAGSRLCEQRGLPALLSAAGRPPRRNAAFLALEVAPRTAVPQGAR